MKKKTVLNLIKYYSENNDSGFRETAYEIARYFDETKDEQLSQYIMSLLSNTNTFVPQLSQIESSFFRKIEPTTQPLPLPAMIQEDIVGLINAVRHNVGVNKFLFEGAPGTGKTETVKQIARILERQLYMVEFDTIIDSKLGQSAKNIVSVFNEIHNLANPANVIILFDEIDAIALDRINTNDLREMGRVTSTMLKEMDKLNEDVLFIATTNLYESFDKALLRRFDSTINFNRYSQAELVEVAESILNTLLKKFKYAGRNMRLFKKVIKLAETIPYPGDLKNIIKTSLAFSKPNEEYDYFRKLINALTQKKDRYSPKELQDKGFTLREIEILTGVSKSKASRELRGK